MGNQGFSCEMLLSDLEYTDDMTLVAASWEDLKAMLQSLDALITISTKTIKTMAVLPHEDIEIE